MNCPDFACRDSWRSEGGSGPFQRRPYGLGGPRWPELVPLRVAVAAAVSGGRLRGESAVHRLSACGWDRSAGKPCKGSPIAGRRSKSRRLRGLQRPKNARKWRIRDGLKLRRFQWPFKRFLGRCVVYIPRYWPKLAEQEALATLFNKDTPVSKTAVSVVRHTIQNSGFIRVQGSGFRIQDLGFKQKESGLRRKDSR